MIKTLKPVIATIVVVVLVVTGLLASGKWNPSWNPFHPLSSMSIVTKSFEALSAAKSMKIDGKVDIVWQIPKQEQGSQASSLQDLFGGNGPTEIGLNSDFVILSDKTDENNPKSQTDLGVSIDVGGVAISGNGRLVSFPGRAYLMIGETPELLEVFMPDLAKAQSQWLKINAEDFASSTLASSSLGFEQDKEFVAELKTLVEGKEILQIKRELGRETINQARTRHYLVSFNKQELKAVLPAFLQLVKKYVPQDEQAQLADIDEILNDFDQSFDALWEKLKGFDFDIWVADGGWLAKIGLDKTIGNNSLKFELVFSDLNKKFDIEEPTSSAPIEDVLPIREWLSDLTASSSDSR